MARAAVALPLAAARHGKWEGGGPAVLVHGGGLCRGYVGRHGVAVVS